MTATAYKTRARILPVCAVFLLALTTPFKSGDVISTVSASVIENATRPETAPGSSTLPSLTLENVRGGTFPLRVQPAQPLLLSFLQTVPDTAPTPSRSQAVFLLSMAHQYGPRGLRVVIVDASVLEPSSALASASALARGSTPTPASRASKDAVLNASYDWHLQIPLLLDPDGKLARQLHVNSLPTTLLVAADGTIIQRWQGLTRPAVLAQGIERLLGGPLGQAPR
jgi:hypothetical protein